MLTCESKHGICKACYGRNLATGALVKLGVADADSPSPVASLPPLPQLPRLHEALRARATVLFSYRGEERRVDPYGLLFRSGFWYLVGRDHVRQALRTFRVDRMDGRLVVGTPASFEIPVDFDAATAFPEEPWDNWPQAASPHRGWPD